MTTRRRRPIAWGLVGAGDIARKRVVAAIQALAPQATLAAVASRRRATAEDLAHERGIPRVLDDWRALVTDPAIDAVYVSTPVDLHAEIAITAARAGKHVLCEKPMALTGRECGSMIRAASRARVRLGVAYYRRFYPVVVRMKQLLDEGAIGTPVLADVLAAEQINPVGRDTPRHWLLEKRRSGGGPMMDFGCHRLDLLLHLLGDIRAAHGLRRNLAFRDRGVEDHATAALSFASGATGHVTASHCFGTAEDRFAVFGTQGKLVVPNLGAGTLDVTIGPRTTRHELPPHANLHFPLLEDFNAAILGRRAPLASGEEGARTSVVLDRIYARC